MHFKQAGLKLKKAGFAVFLAFAIGGATPSAAEPDSTREALAFIAQLERAFSAIASKHTSPNQVKQIVSDLINQMEVVCHSSCTTTLQALTDANQLLGKLQGVDFNKRFEKPKEFDLGSAESREYILRETRKYLEGFSREELKHKITASFELVRFLQNALFARIDVAAKEGREVSTQIAEQAELLVKQAKALISIKDISERFSGEQMSEKDVAEFAKAISDLGLFYKKLAQSMSNAIFLIGPEMANQLKVFQDANVKIPPKEVIEILTEQLGRHPAQIFEGFDAAKPLATGTIAQTYRVQMKTRTGSVPVILKVQRPGLNQMLEHNQFTNRFAHHMSRIMATREVVPFLDVGAGQIFSLEKEIRSEFDFRNEAKNLLRFHRYFAIDPNVRVPQPVMKYTTEKVLVMTVQPGENIDRWIEKSDPATTLKYRKKAFATLLDAFIYNALFIGEMHADLHPGNVLLAKEARVLSLIDVSQVFRTRGLITKPLRFFYHAVTGNVEGFTNAFMSMGAASDQKAVRNIVESAFKEANLERFRMRDTLKAFDSENVEKIAKALEKIIPNTIKAGYEPTPEYVQLVRTALPIFGTLAALKKGMPQKDFTRLLIVRALLVFPKAVLRYTFSIPVHYAIRVRNALWERFMLRPANKCHTNEMNVFNQSTL